MPVPIYQPTRHKNTGKMNLQNCLLFWFFWNTVITGFNQLSVTCYKEQKDNKGHTHKMRIICFKVSGTNPSYLPHARSLRNCTIMVIHSHLLTAIRKMLKMTYRSTGLHVLSILKIELMLSNMWTTLHIIIR